MNVVIRFFLNLLETLFAIGCLGSLTVLILTGIEDTRTIFEQEEPSAEQE